MNDNKKALTVNKPAVIAMMVAALCVGVVYMWSAYKAAAENYYSWTPASANMVSSIMLFAFTGGCFTGGLISDSIGPKRTSLIGTVIYSAGMFLSSALPPTASIGLFYITYSVVSGWGSGFVFTSSLSGIPKWFPDRRGLATGLGAAAFAAATVVFSPVCTALLNHFTMPVTLRIFAAVTFVALIVSCMFIKLPSAEFTKAHMPKADGVNVLRESMTLGQAMHKKGFWLLFACLFLYNGAWNMLTPLIKGLGIERGLTPSVAVLCLSLTGVGNALGRIVMSTLSDKIGRYITMYILCGITAAASLGVTGLRGGGYLIAVLACAFAFGGPAAVYPAMCNDLFGPRYAGRNYGFLMLGLGLSAVVFNALSNSLYAASGSYIPSFVMGAVTALATLLFIAVIKRLTSRAFRREAEQRERQTVPKPQNP